MDNQLPKRLDKVADETNQLQRQIDAIKDELATLEQEIETYEGFLRSGLAGEIIEVQELTILFKQQKHAKKEKRQAQKKKGKNYKEATGLKPILKKKVTEINPEQDKERKRLYREAMLHVHPDRFTMDESQADLATEATTKLIEIYQSGSLSSLQAFHSHIFNGGLLLEISTHDDLVKNELPPNTYLRQELEGLTQQLIGLKNRFTYQVLKTYKNPKSYLYELKAYYRDRIKKLKRRTRTA